MPTKKAQNQELYEAFLIELGVWLVIDGQVQENPKAWWKTREQIDHEFKMWLKKKEYEQKQSKKVSRKR